MARMRIARVIQCVDAHAEGEPSRVVVGGVLDVPGTTMLEKMQALEADGDPAGHARARADYDDVLAELGITA